jgi:hypothetical protein
MRIIQPTEAIPVAHPKVLIVGPTGIGKSSLASSFDSLLLDFDGGAHRAVNRRAVAAIESWGDVELGALQPYAGVAIDTVERCLGMMSVALIAENPRNGSNGSLTPLGWGRLKRRFRAMLDAVEGYGLDLLFVAHAKEFREGELTLVRADIPGGSYGEVLKVADFVGHLSMVNGRRILDFNPTDCFVGKNPGGWPAIVVPAPEHARDFMTELFDQARQALGRRSEASARIFTAVSAWQVEIAALATAEQFTALLARLRPLRESDLPVYAQVHHVLSVAAKAAGMRFDIGLAVFVDTGVRPMPTAPVARPRPSDVANGRAATWQPELYSALTTLSPVVQ